MFEQHLPGYIEAFKTAPWIVRESPHYRSHYVAGSLAEKEIDYIVETQEKACVDILDFLNLPAPERSISYYFYPDADTKKRLMGNPWFAQSVYADFAVHALYTEEHRIIGPHEDMHLLSLPLGLAVGFIQEGLAERMVGHDWFGNSFTGTVREAMSDQHFTFSPDLLVSHQAWLDTPDDFARQYYALAALFSDYLITRFGKEAYFKFYTALQRGATPDENGWQYESVLGIGPDALFTDFKSSLATGSAT